MNESFLSIPIGAGSLTSILQPRRVFASTQQRLLLLPLLLLQPKALILQFTAVLWLWLLVQLRTGSSPARPPLKKSSQKIGQRFSLEVIKGSLI